MGDEIGASMISAWSVLAAASLVAAILLGGVRPRATLLAAADPARGVVPERLLAVLRGRADGPTPVVRTVGALSVAAGVLLTVGVDALGVGASVFAALLAFVVAGRLEGSVARREREALESQIDGVVELLAAALQSGAPLRVAVREVGAVAPEPSAAVLGRVAAQTDIGLSDAEAWAGLRGHTVWGPVARDLARSVDSGAGIADLLLSHADDLRRDLGARAERRARTVGVRSVLPLMCCFLPAFILVGVVPIVMGTLGSLFPA